MWRKSHLLEYLERRSAPLELPSLFMPGLDDLLWNHGQASRVESVAFGTRATYELVQEGDGLLTGVLAFILHHTGLNETMDIMTLITGLWGFKLDDGKDFYMEVHRPSEEFSLHTNPTAGNSRTVLPEYSS